VRFGAIPSHSDDAPMQEYPRAMHRYGVKSLIVSNDAEREAAMKDGWALAPVLEPPAVDVAPAEPVKKAKTKRPD
jgi:hypothetical protein